MSAAKDLELRLEQQYVDHAYDCLEEMRRQIEAAGGAAVDELDALVLERWAAQRLRTSEARGVLPTSLPRAVAVHQMAQVAAIVAACYSNDLALLGRSIDDRIAEPARAPLLPGFLAAKAAAMTAGALGASISGAGPTAFALVAGEEVAERVATAMRDAYARAGVESSTRVTYVDPNGAVVKAA